MTAFDFIMNTVFFFLSALLIWYVFILKPGFEKEDNQKKFVSGLKKGDEVVTTGGIFGSVFSVKDGIVVIEVAANTKLKIEAKHILKPETQTIKS